MGSARSYGDRVILTLILRSRRRRHLEGRGWGKIRECGLPRPSRRVLRTLLSMRKPFTRSPRAELS